MSDDDDTELTEDELAGIRQGWRELIEDRAHNGKLHYSPVKVHGMPLPGSFRLPKDVINKLGENDPQAGGFVAHKLFGIEDTPEDPTVVHPNVVRILGDGSLVKGHKVLQKFISRVRYGAQHDVIEQPDENHGRVVRR
jgi:hypothetical protein